MAQDYEETIKDLKEQIAGLRQSPKRQNSKGKKSTVDGDAKEPRSTPEHLTLRTENSSDSSHGLVERPGAEVSEMIFRSFGKQVEHFIESLFI